MTRTIPTRARLLLGAIAGVVSFTAAGTALAAIDSVAAKKMARKESCLRCHDVVRKKEGPSYQAVAYKYKGKAEAQAELVDHITSGHKVKLSDGHEEDHKVTKTKDPAQIGNLIGWILAQ